MARVADGRQVGQVGLAAAAKGEVVVVVQVDAGVGCRVVGLRGVELDGGDGGDGGGGGGFAGIGASVVGVAQRWVIAI